MIQIHGGLLPDAESEDGRYSMCRYEYRLMSPSNRLFLIQYLVVDAEGKFKPMPEEKQGPPTQATFNQITNPNVQQRQLPQPQTTQMRPQQFLQSLGNRPAIPQPSKAAAPPPTIFSAGKKAPPSRMPLATAIPPGTQQPQQATDDTFILALDDFDGITKVDLAFERLKFQKTVLAKLFCPASIHHPPQGEDRSEGVRSKVLSLVNAQINLMEQEVEHFSNLHELLGKNEGEKRDRLNGLFGQLSECTDLDSMMSLRSDWESVAGYSIVETETQTV